jgi:hypothetical protein
MPAGPQPIQLLMAPFPEGWSGSLDEQWQQAAQLLEGTVIVSGTSTPTKLYFSFVSQWPAGFKGEIDATWAMGTSMLGCGTATQTIPLTITPFPDGFQGTLNETWQQAITQMTGAVP